MIGLGSDKNVDAFAICLLAAPICNRLLGPEPGDEQFPTYLLALIQFLPFFSYNLSRTPWAVQQSPCHSLSLTKDKAWLYQFWKPDTLKYSFHVTLGFNCICFVFCWKEPVFKFERLFITLVSWSPYNFSWAAGFDTFVTQYHHWPMHQRHFHLLYVSAATEYLLLTCLATEKATTKNLLIWNGSLRTY